MMNNYGYYDPTKTLITSCPNCGARPQARVWSRLAVQAMSVYSPTTQPGVWGTYASAIHPLVCSHCGLVEFFTDPRNFHAETEYQPSSRCLVLQGRTLCSGDMLEVSIMGDWVSGMLAHDVSGWYILTIEQTGIRLREGIPARLVNTSSIPMTKKEH